MALSLARPDEGRISPVVRSTLTLYQSQLRLPQYCELLNIYSFVGLWFGTTIIDLSLETGRKHWDQGVDSGSSAVIVTLSCVRTRIENTKDENG